MINLAKETGARLIHFDNVYMYGLVNGAMKEDTPYNPSSIKGEIRAQISTKLMDEAKAGNIKASIARAADFYGTDSGNSFFDMMVLANYAKKQRAQWIGDPQALHNQIWHMPTAPAMPGKQLIELAAKIYGVEPKYFAVNKFMLWAYGLFNKTVMGTVEMYYQYNHDYIFDSSKFEKAFNFKPTGYEEGIKLMSETLYKKDN
jgi:nucleoside-diphosphate-sugar epimerase